MEKKISTKNLIEKLIVSFPGISGIKDASEWSGQYKKNSCIFLGDAAEGGTIDGYSACDYYIDDYDETLYIMGVHKDLSKYLDQFGFYVECYNPGTYIACKNY